MPRTSRTSTRPSGSSPRSRRSSKREDDPARAALLAAVLADPADDAARTVYADHLIAAGDPRGEFIAVQLELARHGDATERQKPKTKPLWQRFRDLHARHSGTWVKPIRALGKHTSWTLHRGFVRSLRIADATVTGARLAEVLAVEPVVDLAIENVQAARLAQLLDTPGIERVRRLTVFGYDARRVGTYVARAIAAATRLRGLEELRVGIKLHDAGLAALASAANLPRVTHLCVGAAFASDAADLAFLQSPLARQLEILEWCRDDVTADMIAALVEHPRLTAVMASDGYVANPTALAKRFRDDFTYEDQDSFDYLFVSPLSRV